MKRQNLRARRWLVALSVVLLATGGAALAQEMPPPHKSPRVPVNRQALSGSAAALPSSREVEGPALIIDGEHLHVNDIDLRLFGVVPPQLSASFGPQARAALDELTRGQNVSCHVRDRDHDGRFLATCLTANGRADLALELLRRGLAVTARGSLQPTDLAAPYAAAEQASQAKKLGLWSVVPPPPAAIPAPTPAPVIISGSSSAPAPAAEPKKEEKAADNTVSVLLTDKTTSSFGGLSLFTTGHETGLTDKASSQASLPTTVSGKFSPPEEESASAPGFFARYQLLFTGLVMLMTAFGIMAVLAVQRRRDQRDEMKAIAAALRGELLAARAVCLARLKTWNETDDRDTVWPRLRATLYQAYVGRLGWLGAVLARQVASIYGQAADYTAYFAPGGEAQGGIEAKRQALQTLIHHIEEVLPRLAAIEQSGARPKGEIAVRPRDFMNAPSTMTPPAPSVTRAAAPPPPVSHVSNKAAVYSAVSWWDSIRKSFFAQRPEPPLPPVEEPVMDYTAIIEEEMARMSYDEDIHEQPPSNVSNIRTGS